MSCRVKLYSLRESSRKQTFLQVTFAFCIATQFPLNVAHTHTHGHCSQFTSPQDTNSWCHAENFTATWYQHSIVSVEDTASTSALCWFITNTFCHFRCTQRWFALRSLRARCYIKLSEYVRVNIAVRVSDAC